MPSRRVFFSTGIAFAGTVGSSALRNRAAAQELDAPKSTIDGYEYRLPKFDAGSRLLFQGDSITDMKWGRNQKDRNHYLGHSYVYLIAARLGVDMADVPLDIYNRGMSGHTVADLRQRWQQDAVEMNPDILSILIGTNDVGRDVQAQAFESDYRHILDASRKANPKLRIVLLDPFVLKCGRLKDDKAWASRRKATDKLGAVVARIAPDYQAVHIRTQEIFDRAAENVSAKHWIWDGIHPLPQGHELIARNWIAAISQQAG